MSLKGNVGHKICSAVFKVYYTLSETHGKYFGINLGLS